MCGIFGQVSTKAINTGKFKKLVSHSKQRGRDSSGLIYFNNNLYDVAKADYDIEKLISDVNPFSSNIVLGHSRLITNGLNDNQPVIRSGMALLHNGIIVNHEKLWEKNQKSRIFEIDSEIILAIAEDYISSENEINKIPEEIIKHCIGIVSCALVIPRLGKLLLFSNNGSLYKGSIGDDIYFASERYGLEIIDCKDIIQIKEDHCIIDIPRSSINREVKEIRLRNENLIPEFSSNTTQKEMLEYSELNLQRCKKCILPSTMPFIYFNSDGICNYCENYTPRNIPKPKEELFNLVEKYRKPGNQLDCIVPFSGGRDSCYSLHLIVNELKMKPVTYTYDWGMVTDLGRRNISQMCSSLGVENIIIAADISQKRKNIKMNLQAWLKNPNLGMMALLTAGDKHFFRYVEDIKRQTGINLNLWGVNPLEVTHFKAGFLGIPPYFEEKRVYTHGITKQLRYHLLRFKEMLKSPGYFNSSLWDTLSGEYYRSFTKKDDYFHVFDYWRWDEDVVNKTLIDDYNWETAIDTDTTWRIGDGTAAFYNYVNYTVAGFTEHDTFRSNQIREGQISREEALSLVKNENRPRYQNIRWYLDTLGMSFEEVIKVVNSIPKMYSYS